MAEIDPINLPPQWVYGGLVPQKGTGSVYFNCTLHQVVSRVSEVTDNPIEDGSSVVDHIIHRPLEVSLEVILYGAGFFGESSAELRLSALDYMRVNGRLLTLMVSTLDDATSLSTGEEDVGAGFAPNDLQRSGREGKNQYKSYENMLVTSLVVTDTPDIGIVTESIRLSLKLKQVKIVKSVQETVTLVKHKKKKRGGFKGADAAYLKRKQAEQDARLQAAELAELGQKVSGVIEDIKKDWDERSRAIADKKFRESDRLSQSRLQALEDRKKIDDGFGF